MPFGTAVIGDVGGHLAVFAAALAAAGVDVPSRRIPDGLTVVQVGDLVHKGPDSAGCVAMADQMLRANPGHYLQLLGNHEAHYLGGPDVAGRPGVVLVDDATQTTLHRWWRDGWVNLAADIAGPDGREVLVTHGGLTCGLWHELGSPTSAASTAERVNALREDPLLAFRPGWLMTGHHDHAAGVTNPRTGAELAASWLVGGPMPFDQVHGHEGAWSWPLEDWHADVPAEVRRRTVVDHERRFSTIDVPGGTLTSVDWVLGTEAPDRAWEPYVVAGSPRG